jgi:hypothetical protein
LACAHAPGRATCERASEPRQSCNVVRFVLGSGCGAAL